MTGILGRDDGSPDPHTDGGPGDRQEEIDMSDQSQQGGPGSKSFTERIELAGDQLVSTITGLVKDSTVRRIVIRDQNDKKLFAVPMPAGVAIGGLAVLAAPTLAAIGAITALVTKVHLDIVRTDVGPGDGPVVDAQTDGGDDPARPRDGSGASQS